MRHTCDTAVSGSERSEDTCATCHAERSRGRAPVGYGDVLGDWLQQTARVGRKLTAQKDGQP